MRSTSGSRGWGLAVLLTGVLTAWSSTRATPALVVDAQSQAVLLAEDAGQPWYPASTTKLMTAYVVFQALSAGAVTMDTPVVLSKNAMGEASLHAGLRVGRVMRLEDALYAVIVGSVNDVAVALAETVGRDEGRFVARMNAAARELGMSASQFANPNGLFDAKQHTTARDLAILGLALDREFPQHRRFFQTGRVVIDGKSLESYNILLTRYPGTLGMKTGFICAAGRNIVALAKRGERRVLVVLLGATTDRERGERAAQLLDRAFMGEFPETSTTLVDLPNDQDRAPEDMRGRLCSDQTAGYETERNALFPMGLPGERSYLGATTRPRTYSFETLENAALFNVPIPTPRPAALDLPASPTP